MSFSSLASNFLVLSFLPNLVQHFLNFIHPYFYKPSKIPYPGQTKYYRNYVLCFFTLALAYLIYNLYQVYIGLNFNHYEILGISRIDFSQKTLKKTFNQLSLYFHPDKNPNNEQIYLKLSKSYEILKSPNKRYIYDVLGDFGLKCKDCKVLQNYIRHHLGDMFIFYASSIFFLGVYILLGFQSNFYWKFVILGFLFYLEFGVLLGQIKFTLFTSLFPTKTPYEFTLYFRQLAFDLIYLTTHISNLILPNTESQQSKAFQHCQQLVNSIGIRVTRAFDGQIINHPPASQQKLLNHFKKWQELELMTGEPEFHNSFIKHTSRDN